MLLLWWIPLTEKECSKNAPFGTRTFSWQTRIKLVNFHSPICCSTSPVEHVGSRRDRSTEIGGSWQKLKAVLRHFHSLGFTPAITGPVGLRGSAVRRLEAHGDTHCLRLARVNSDAPKKWELTLVALESDPQHGFWLLICIYQWNSPLQ